MCPTRNVVIAQRVSVSPNASAKRHDETEPSLPQRAPNYQPWPSTNSKPLETWRSDEPDHDTNILCCSTGAMIIFTLSKTSTPILYL
jgi:hypothetical protein